MIRTVNQKVNLINKKIGLNYEIPLPSRNALEINEKINIAMSVASLSLCLLTQSKVLLGVGVLSGLSAALTHVEKKKI